MFKIFQLVIFVVISFYPISILADEDYEIDVQVKTSGTPKPSIMDNLLTSGMTGYPWLILIENYFTNEWFESPPTITPTLGKGYTWMPMYGIGDLYAVPTFHYEIHAWDKNQSLPATDLEIHRTLKD